MGENTSEVQLMEKIGGSQWYLDFKVVLPVVIVATALLTLVATGEILFAILSICV